MKPFYQDNNTIYCTDFRENDLPDESVQCVVTSPPYWGLRKYSGEQELIWGGDPTCEHEWVIEQLEAEIRTGKGLAEWSAKYARGGGHKAGNVEKIVTARGYCLKCGAWKGAYGLEPTPEMYIQHTIEILREIRRVLRKDGVVFWNIGDSYAGSNSGKGDYREKKGLQKDIYNYDHPQAKAGKWDKWRRGVGGEEHGVSLSGIPLGNLKPKDLCLIPFRVAIAAQEPYYAGRIKNELDRVWMAAMIDSEGTVCGFRHERPDGNIRTGVLVFVTNGNENILNKCDHIWPGSRYLEHLKAGDKVLGATATQDCWRWQIQKAEDRSLFLREIYPYMVAKKLQVMIGWNLNEYSLQAKKMGRGGETKEVKARREILAKILSDLNQHRPVDIPKWVKEPPSVLEPGWWVRSVIVWSKNNPMPESVTDRPTESHEYILMLTKSARYYWDADAVREQSLDTAGVSSIDEDGSKRYRKAWNDNKGRDPKTDLASWAGKYGSTTHTGGRNIRSVWEFPTQPYPEAHFAVFPEKLPELCIKAATPEVGCCSKCGAPWERITKPTKEYAEILAKSKGDDWFPRVTHNGYGKSRHSTNESAGYETLGWQPTCKCNADKVPSIVLDPFMGAGTTLWVAKKLNRKAVGYDTSAEYCQLAVDRCRQQVLL